MTVPLAPRREPIGSGHLGFDKVSHLAALARGWFKLQGVPHTGGDVIAMAALALAAQQEIDEKAAKPKPSSPAPGHARRPANPPAKKEPSQ